MSTRWKLLPIALVLLLMGCTAPSATAPSSPKEYGARESRSGVWSVEPGEFLLDGLRLGDRSEAVTKRYGKATQLTPLPVGAGGSIKAMTEYEFANGITVTDADGRIYRLQASRSAARWEAARGIKAGTACETVLARFGPSHDGPGTYIYYARGSEVSTVMTLVFSCQQGQVVGVDMHGF